VQTATAIREAAANAGFIDIQSEPPRPRNGVDTPALLATVFGVIASRPALAAFRFCAANRWVTGTHSRTVMLRFRGAAGEHSHLAEYTAEGDYPAVLCGTDEAPAPVEWLLHALATCLAAGIANIAATRGITLRRVQSSLEGDIDLCRISGPPDEARAGHRSIRVVVEIQGDGPPDVLRDIVEHSRDRSAVFDILANGVPVAVAVDAVP